MITFKESVQSNFDQYEEARRVYSQLLQNEIDTDAAADIASRWQKYRKSKKLPVRGFHGKYEDRDIFLLEVPDLKYRGMFLTLPSAYMIFTNDVDRFSTFAHEFAHLSNRIKSDNKIHYQTLGTPYWTNHDEQASFIQEVIDLFYDLDNNDINNIVDSDLSRTEKVRALFGLIRDKNPKFRSFERANLTHTQKPRKISLYKRIYAIIDQYVLKNH